MIKQNLKNALRAPVYGALRTAGVQHPRLVQLLGGGVKLFQWDRIVARTRDPRLLAPPAEGPRIVAFAVVGNTFLTDLELTLALALQARGARVELVVCDGLHPRCELTTAEVLEKRDKAAVCAGCVGHFRRLARGLPLRVRYLSELVPAEEMARVRAQAAAVPLDERLGEYAPDGAGVGEAAQKTALRHFQSGVLPAGEMRDPTLRGYLEASLITKRAAEVLAAEGGLHTVLMSHGIYSSWGPALDVFRAGGVPVVTYGKALRRNTFFFNVNSSAANIDITGSWESRYRTRALDPAERAAALDYLGSREDFSQDSVRYTFADPAERESVLRTLGLDPSRPVITLFTNNLWDAAAVGRDLVFPTAVDWAVETVRFVAERPRLQLVVKPHPAEAIRGTRQSIGSAIAEAFPRLPPNVLVLPPDTTVNPTSMMKATTIGVVHTSTVGLEMSAHGIPAVVVSRAHYREKGFTFDPAGIDEYFALLEQPEALVARMTPEHRELALKYFYVWVHRYQHLLDLFEEDPAGWIRIIGYRMDSLDDLLPGRHRNLDFICDGILRGLPDLVAD
ncbi:MAG TPA: hypothetical protein VEX86_17370 [Longimicrobium sp.]|nr:hypothetical protein [Longimicrobium sp.]